MSPSPGYRQQNRHPTILCPLVWTLLNVAALSVSFFVAIHLILALTVTEGSRQRPAAAFYLIWNFLTTLLWVVEVSFRVHAWKQQLQRKGSANAAESTTSHSVALVIEWTFAILFTVDSLKLLVKWRLKKEDIQADLIEVLLNVVAYSYITVATLIDYKSLMQEERYQTIPELENASDNTLLV